MNLKMALAVGTAVGLLATGAQADSNLSRIIQAGTGNTANVDQAGKNNVAGSPSYANHALNQNGNNNTIDISQTGSGNRVGSENNSLPGSSYTAVPSGWGFGIIYGLLNDGVDQIGSKNTLEITQANPATQYEGNIVGTVKQTSLLAASAAANSATITQNAPGSSGYARNVVGEVIQDNTGGAVNDVDITQTGANYYNNNRIVRVTQKGTGNDFDATQTGEGNLLTLAEQKGAGGTGGSNNKIAVSQTGGNDNLFGSLSQIGDNNYLSATAIGSGNQLVSVSQNNSGAGTVGNSATLSFTGLNNGVGMLTGDAATVGVTLATVNQLGDNNQLSYLVTGNSNLYGFNQIGNTNSITGTVTNSNNNQVAVYQNGASNTAVFAQSGGGGNNAGITQTN